MNIILYCYSSQLWANYKRKSGESLSLLFLYIWLIGDIFCIVGLILSQLDLFQIILAGYYAVVDCLMIIQGSALSFHFQIHTFLC